MKIIHFWWRNARAKALPQSILPAILAICMASRAPEFSIFWGVLAVLGIMFGHLGMNLFDDYFDYKAKGVAFRDEMARKGMRARVAKCQYLTSGAATTRELFIVACIFGVAALTIGTIIFLQRGVVVVYFAVAAMLLGISYSGAPLRLSYRGLGEFVIGLVFGPLLMGGVYYAACGTLNNALWFVSIPIGLLVMNIIFVHSIMDYEPDKECGKMTFAVLLNNKKSMLTTLFILLFFVFAATITGVVVGYLGKPYLFVLLTLPMAISLFYLMWEFVYYPQRTFKPRFWMGPMGNWNQIEAIGIDWFMIRWLLARNLLSFFCLIIILITFIF